MARVAASPTLLRVTIARRLAPLFGLVAGYALAVRPRLLRWGATDEEVAGRTPGPI